MYSRLCLNKSPGSLETLIYRQNCLQIISAACNRFSPSSNRVHTTPNTHIHKHTRPCPFQSTSSDCIHLHLTPQIVVSICLRVWLHVCHLQRCASFDLNSYPTAYYRVCCSYSTDCSRLRNLNFSRLPTPGALSFQQWHTVTFKWNPCLSVVACVNWGMEEPDNSKLTFVLLVMNWSEEVSAWRNPHRKWEEAEISAVRLKYPECIVV